MRRTPRLCGLEESTHKVFEPEIPVAAADESTVREALTVSERLAPVLSEGQALLPPESTKAFLTEVNGRTLISAPANVFTTEREVALHANEHFLWMQGRFVGAEKANRNGRPAPLRTWSWASCPFGTARSNGCTRLGALSARSRTPASSSVTRRRPSTSTAPFARAEVRGE